MKRVAVMLYRVALLAFPAEFRRRLGDSMTTTFEALVASRGLRVVPRELTNVVAHGLSERWAERRRAPRIRAHTRIELLARDVKHAVRTLARSPGFTLVAVASLALGIGANTAIFSVVNAILLKPMPIERPNEIVAIYSMRPANRFPSNLSYPNYLDIAAETSLFSDVVGFQGAAVNSSAAGEPELIWSELVTANYFDGLGVRPAIGRTPRADESEDPLVVLSYGFWQRRFQGDDGVLGETLQLNGHDFTVVGVARRGFSGAKMLGFTPDVWIPITWHAAVSPGNPDRLEERASNWLIVRARLASGVSLDRASAALDVLSERLEAEYPDANENWQLHAMASPRKSEPFFEVMTGGAIPTAAGALLAIVGIVLLVACANVASLQLARAATREKEMALRLSLGGSRRQILRQLFLESLLLSAAAGLVGLWLSGRLMAEALRLNPVFDFAIDYGIGPDGRVLAFTLAVSVAAGMLSGLLPAVKLSRRDITASLNAAQEDARAGRGFIVVPQIALSLVALVIAGLLIRSFDQAQRVRPGFDTSGIALASFHLGLQGYGVDDAREFHRALLARVRALPSVTSATLAFPLPLDAYQSSARILPHGAGGASDDEEMNVLMSAVGDDYFDTMGTPIVRGRGFRQQDGPDAPLVAVINETLAQRLFPESEAVGGRFRVDRKTAIEVVGVARDGKYLTLGEDPRPYLFVPLSQDYEAPVTLVVRSLEPLDTLEAQLRSEVQALDPTLPLYGVKTIGQFLDRPLAGPRALALIVSFFAVLAVTLAVIGIYSLMSVTVSQKQRELGIRMALGASAGDVVKLFVARASRIIAIGIGIGLLLAWGASRAVESLLYGVGAGDAATFLSLAAALAAVALLGSYVPSRRAAKLDPLVTLRHE